VLKLALPNTTGIVEKNADPAHPSVDTKISIDDRREFRSDGLARKKVIALDSRSLGWMPNVMVIALLGATPGYRPYHRRAFLISLLVVNLFISGTILVSICHGWFSGVFFDWRGPYFSYAYRLFVLNLWMTFLVPTLIWIGSLIWALNRGLLHFPICHGEGVVGTASDPRAALSR
jgi:hypothetical protein